MIEWCLCNTAAATASWASMHLDGFLERTASGDWFRRDSSRTGDKRQPARCSRKTEDKFAIASMATKSLHCCIGAHAQVHMYFLRGVWHACRQVLWAPCMCRYVRKQVLWTSAYTFAYTLATGYAYALMYVQFVHLALGNEGWGPGFNWSMRAYVACRGVLFLTEGERGVVSVSARLLIRV